MKAQMYFDSKAVSGGGSVCRTNTTGAISPSTNNTATGGDDDGESDNNRVRKVRKCKRVRRIRRRVLSQKRRNGFGEGNREIRGEMIKDYLCKLQELVPFSRKDKRLSKLEVITNAIDYIRELRETLGLPPCVSSPALSNPTGPDTEDIQRLPSLTSPTFEAEPSPFYSLIPENCNSTGGDDQSNANAILEDTASISTSASENCPGPNLEQQSMDIAQGNWGHLRPALWTISVPCNQESESFMISSSLSSDKITS